MAAAAVLVQGALPMGEHVWEMARILEGRPGAGKEVTGDYNPLEAGLYAAISLDKGCYIGQQALVKVAGAGPLKQQLYGLKGMRGECVPGASVTADGQALGKVTSVTKGSDGLYSALAYLRCRARRAQVELEGMFVDVDGQEARVTALPFLQKGFRDDQLPASMRSSAPSTSADTPSGAGLSERKAEGVAEAEKAAAAKAAARAAKLQAMQDRLAAFQESQGQSDTTPGS